MWEASRPPSPPSSHPSASQTPSSTAPCPPPPSPRDLKALPPQGPRSGPRARTWPSHKHPHLRVQDAQQCQPEATGHRGLPMHLAPDPELASPAPSPAGLQTEHARLGHGGSRGPAAPLPGRAAHTQDAELPIGLDAEGPIPGTWGPVPLTREEIDGEPSLPAECGHSCWQEVSPIARLRRCPHPSTAFGIPGSHPRHKVGWAGPRDTEPPSRRTPRHPAPGPAAPAPGLVGNSYLCPAAPGPM